MQFVSIFSQQRTQLMCRSMSTQWNGCKPVVGQLHIYNLTSSCVLLVPFMFGYGFSGVKREGGGGFQFYFVSGS